MPRVVDGDDGPRWVLGDRTLGPSGRRGKGLVTTDDPGYRPGIPHERLADMDRDGIYCHVVYGVPLGFPVPDLEVRAACMRAYNDWAADFNANVPGPAGRVGPLAIPLTGRRVLAELTRAAELGHRGAILDLLVADEPAFEDEWETFWAVANALRCPSASTSARACTASGRNREAGGCRRRSRWRRCSSTRC